MSPLTAIALIVGCAAIVDDLVRRKISNWISLAAVFSGVGVHCLQDGWRGGLLSIEGALAGGGVFLLFYLLGGLGGGDIKLMTGFGAVLGTSRVLEAAFWTAACGGVLATAAIAISAARRCCNGRPEAMVVTDSTAAPKLESIPYAPAIAFGVWISLISHVPATRGSG